MSYTLIAKGNADNLNQLGAYQPNFPENSRGVLALELNSSAVGVVSWVDNAIKKAGVPSPRVEADGNNLNIFLI